MRAGAGGPLMYELNSNFHATLVFRYTINLLKLCELLGLLNVCGK